MSRRPGAGPPGATGALVALVAVTAVWGSTFVVVKDAVARMPTADFLVWRFGIAALALVALRPRALAALPPAGRRAGAGIGLLLGLGYLTQTLGLERTSASVSGFLTGLFVVLTPLLAGLVLHRRVGRGGWIGTALATAGLALIALHGLAIGAGELLALACAVAFAGQIVALGEVSGAYPAVGLTQAQLLAAAALFLLVAAGRGQLAPPPDAGAWLAVVATALAATVGGYLVQTWAQARVPPTRTAVVLTTEPVFAGIFGVLVGGDRLTARTVLGGLLVVAGMLAAELTDRRAEPAPAEYPLG